MAVIGKIKGLEIFDSRGIPTLEVHCWLDSGQHSIASVPSGAFVSQFEAIPTKDISTAINNIEAIISPTLVGKDPVNLPALDNLMITTDGSPTKENLGANTMLGVSIALARLGAVASGLSLVEYLQQIYNLSPTQPQISPMLNIINGGAHADNNLTFQEFMVVPMEPNLNFRQKMIQGTKIFKILKNRLERIKKSTNVGDEGGYAPELNSNEEAIEILIESIEEAGYQPGKQIGLALDIAAGGIPDLMIATYPKQPANYYQDLISNYPIVSLEDPFRDDDWQNWGLLNQVIGTKIALVGDDLFTTNPIRLLEGIKQKSANSISIKPNQVGTVTQTIETIKLAVQNNFGFQISHRSGETEDTFISDLAVATGAKYLKAGAPNRGERIAKYNQIIRLENNL